MSSRGSASPRDSARKGSVGNGDLNRRGHINLEGGGAARRGATSTRLALGANGLGIYSTNPSLQRTLARRRGNRTTRQVLNENHFGCAFSFLFYFPSLLLGTI